MPEGAAALGCASAKGSRAPEGLLRIPDVKLGKLRRAISGSRELKKRTKVPIVGSDKCHDVCLAILVIAARDASAPGQRIGLEMPRGDADVRITLAKLAGPLSHIAEHFHMQALQIAIWPVGPHCRCVRSAAGLAFSG